MGDMSTDMGQTMDNGNGMEDEMSMEDPSMNDTNMDSEFDGGMEGDMTDSTEVDSTMEIINKLSEKDKKAVEAYAESLLSTDETNTNDETDEQIPDGLDMEQPVNESFIFTKKQLSKLMENFGPTNDELEKKENNTSKMKKNTVRNSPFNSPKFN
jgi:hypothetical protein